MLPPRQFALIRTEDQWRRVAHDKTALDGEIVQLAWVDNDQVDSESDWHPLTGGGLAFDGFCRLYHSVPDEGLVERLLWADTDFLPPQEKRSDPLALIESEVSRDLGEFALSTALEGPLLDPQSLAVNDEEHLFIAEAGARRILIYDLLTRHLLRKILLNGRPLDLATKGRTVFVLTNAPARLLKLDSRRKPEFQEVPKTVTSPSKLAISPTGEIFLLDQAGTDNATIVSLSQPDVLLPVPRATDLEFLLGDTTTQETKNHTLVVARFPNEDFRRFRMSATARLEIQPLKARDYDGVGIVRTPDNRIGFWTTKGFRQAVGARVRYVPKGKITSFRLDSQVFQTEWGKLFLDACIPLDTEVRIHCVTADEPPGGVTLPRTPPSNMATMEVYRPDLSPPMPPISFVAKHENTVGQALHRRETGRELPWARMSEDDRFLTYEAPILANPGRYLWVTIELMGNTRVTPRIRALRAEYPSHDYLRRLPKVYSRNSQGRGFLQRYLAVLEGLLSELEGKADNRQALFDPLSAPPEILPWLAGFLGLINDERWAISARRNLIQAATWLFRFRGTNPGLIRFLEIYTGTRVFLIEKFKLRGFGETVLGDSPGLVANSILGAGFRVGGAVGDREGRPLTGTLEDGFKTHAHRFSVVIAASLSPEQREVVRSILDLHRPAHTVFDLCTLETGMRVGRGLHVGLTSLIGLAGGFRPLQLGNSLLGRGGVLGRARAGIRPESSRLGHDSRIG